MDAINLLDKNALEKIGHYIDLYGGDTRKDIYRSVSVEHILRIWNRAKSPLLPLFGNKLMVSKPITFTEEKDDILNRIDNYTFKHELYDRFVKLGRQLEIDENNKWEFHDTARLLSLFNPSYLYNNIYTGKVIEFTDFKILPGIKTMKAIAKIVKAYGLNMADYEEFRIKISQLIENKAQHATLVLSIHPLDFMTMSDNSYKWRSCMNWRRHGEYRLGTVEMMNSPCIVMAYLCGKEPFQFNDYNWTNKKWRELFIVTPDIISGIRQYPYFNNIIHKTALDMLREMAEKSGYSHYNDETYEISDSERTVVKYKENLNRSIMISAYTHFMYNDYDRLDHDVYISTDRLDEEEFNYFEINYSGEAECMSCGDIIDYDYDYVDEYSEFLVCTNCCNYIQCEECGEWIDPDNLIYDEHYGSYFCEYCHEKLFDVCPICGERHYNNNMRDLFVVLSPEEMNYSSIYRDRDWDERNILRVCYNCLDKLNITIKNDVYDYITTKDVIQDVYDRGDAVWNNKYYDRISESHNNEIKLSYNSGVEWVSLDLDKVRSTCITSDI